MTLAATFETELSVSPARRHGVLRATFGFLAAIADAATILVLSLASGLVYHLAVYGQPGPMGIYLQVGALATSLFLLPNIARNEYTISTYLTAKGHAQRSFYLWSAAFLCLLVLGFLTKTTEDYSRGWLALFYAAGSAALRSLGWRWCAGWRSARRSAGFRRAG